MVYCYNYYFELYYLLVFNNDNISWVFIEILNGGY